MCWRVVRMQGDELCVGWMSMPAIPHFFCGCQAKVATRARLPCYPFESSSRNRSPADRIDVADIFPRPRHPPEIT